MKKSITALALIAAVSSPVMAEGMYIGASIGSTDLQWDDLEEMADYYGASYDNEDTGFKLTIGNRINQNFAIEGFYAYLGEAVYQDAWDTATIEASTFGGSAVAIMPINETLEFYVKAGLHMWTAELQSVGLNNGSITDDGTGFTAGIGMAIQTEKLTFNVGYDNYRMDDVDVNMLSAGVAIKF